MDRYIPEDQGTSILRNVCNRLPSDAVSYSRSTESSNVCQWKQENPYVRMVLLWNVANPGLPGTRGHVCLNCVRLTLGHLSLRKTVTQPRDTHSHVILWWPRCAAKSLHGCRGFANSHRVRQLKCEDMTKHTTVAVSGYPSLLGCYAVSTGK